MKTIREDTTTYGDMRVLSRGLAMIECFSAGRPSLSLTEVAAAVGLPVPTTWRFLQTLVRLGYLTVSPSKRYQASVKTFALVQGSMGRLAQLDPYPRLGALASQTGVGWILHVLDGVETVMVAFGFAHPIHVGDTPMGHRFPALSYAPGVALAAFLDQSGREQLLSRTTDNPVDRAALETCLERAKRDGFAAMDSPPLASVCAPVFDHQDEPVCAVGVIGFQADSDSKLLAKRWAVTVKRVALEFSESMR